MIVRAVIDLLNGRVVRGVKGQRDAYSPIQSCLTQSTAPDDIALAIFESTGIEHFYLADLDSIIHKKDPQWDLLALWDSRGWEVWADFGLDGFQALLPWPSIVQVVATETWQEKPQSLLNPVHLSKVLSLDSLDGNLIGEAAKHFASPNACLAAWDAVGISDLLWMDLSRVGSYQGPMARQNLPTCHPDLKVHAAGGVRGPLDLCVLKDQGFAGVLVASAIHDGRLKAGHLAPKTGHLGNRQEK